MKVCVNSRFLTHSISGAERFAIELCYQLKILIPELVFLAPSNGIVQHQLAQEFNVVQFGCLENHLWEQIELPLYLKKNGNPLLVNLLNTAPLFYKNQIISVLDIAFVRFPGTFSFLFRRYYQYLIPKILRRSKRIVSISEFSKKEIIEYYNIDPRKISVIYCAVPARFIFNNNQLRDLDAVVPAEKYILAVGALQPQKNLKNLVKAFLLLNDSELNLYIIGASRQNFRQSGISQLVEGKKNIKLLGRVGDDELIKFYKNALCFVFPSFYEGFGIPPLEAQAMASPVIVSNVASLPEIFGDSALYCDPSDINDIKDKIHRIATDKSLRRELLIKSNQNWRRFSWRDSAVKMAELINSEIAN